MAVFLRDTPIKRKLMLVVLFASTFSLFLMGSALITYELITFRRALAVNIGVLAKIIGSNITASVAFRDAKSAEEILSALSAETQVTGAAIYDEKGRIFVRFPTNTPLNNFPTGPGADGHRFGANHLEMFRPIVQEGSRLGTIYLQADLGEMYSRFAAYGALLLFVTAGASLGAIGFTTTLQKRISHPVLELAKVATAVSERQDYSVRATKHGADEIGQLTDSFNQMLTRIGASEERLRLALEGSQTGTWDWNISSGRITWDDYMYSLFRRNKEEFDGTMASFMKIIHPDDRAEFEEATRRALAGENNINIDFRIIDSDDTVRHMSSRGRAYYDLTGRAVRMSGVSLDVTASKRYEEDLSRAKEEAEAANKAKDNFLAILSHELRTPLSPVLTAVAMLEEDHTTAPHALRELEMIRRNIEVEARLIDDLLDVTAIIRGKLELHRQVVDVRSLLEHAMQNYCAADARKKNLRVSIEATPSEAHVLADSSRLTQVFWNLLQNACKFTPAGGAIDIRVYNESADTGTAEGEQLNRADLVVEIKDTGIGISPENMPRLFKAFEQGERSRTRVFGGLGLGLTISRAIVEMHGGTIVAESEGMEKGAKVTIRLRTVEPTPSARDALNRGPSPTRSTTYNRRLRILLVEDHRDTGEQLTRLLKRAGHEVVWASTIREARELMAEQPGRIQQNGFNIVISDLGLPDGSGHDLMRELATQRSIRGIALSGYGMKDDIRDSMASGFSRHITKPVDWHELKDAIQKLAASDVS